MVDLDQDGIDQFQEAVVRTPDLLRDLMVAPRHGVAEHSNGPNSPGALPLQRERHADLRRPKPEAAPAAAQP